jgi:hypothetical protein
MVPIKIAFPDSELLSPVADVCLRLRLGDMSVR